MLERILLRRISYCKQCTGQETGVTSSSHHHTTMGSSAPQDSQFSLPVIFPLPHLGQFMFDGVEIAVIKFEPCFSQQHKHNGGKARPTDASMLGLGVPGSLVRSFPHEGKVRYGLWQNDPLHNNMQSYRRTRSRFHVCLFLAYEITYCRPCVTMQLPVG